ncbi:MAG: FAD-dependent oxidoreductase [Dehalococcoidia bacterium]|nr:FAD-dependent oxidoreductase [Dehalococcoidia bacterium]MDD5494582.1 FAD-dependent oxidoreductase [Dehalococcoidia bacterium]
MATISKTDVRPASQIHGEKCWPMVDKLSPCEKACPLGTDVPSYIMAIALGKFDEALAAIRQTNPFPSVCGRVCHQPCEIECNRALIDDPIAIRWLKRAAVDYSDSKKKRTAKVKLSKKGRVAVVGSGPAGLTAAYDLVKKGYGVTVFESADTPGGWLTNGIPDFILPAGVARADIQNIIDSGVDVRTGVKIGKDLSLFSLKDRGYTAILLATGAQKSTSLNLTGSNLKNILSALDILKKARMKGEVLLHGRVLVIGGGAVAMDAARTALRLGAQEVTTACLESRRKMPAWPWEIEAAEKEGVKVLTSLAPQKFSGLHNAGGARGILIDFKRVASTKTDAEGRVSWKLAEGPGSDLSLEADYVIIAIGQAADTAYAEGSPLLINKRGAFDVDPDTLETNVPGIFAAGDSVNIRGTVTESIAMGHKAAAAIEIFLKGTAPKAKNKQKEKEVIVIDPKLTSPWLARKARWGMPSLSPKDAVRTFSEAYLGFTREEAIEEARRCLNCRMCANCIYGRGQICYETAMRLLK